MIADIFVFGRLDSEHIVQTDSLVLLLQRRQNGRRDQGGDCRDDGEHHQKFDQGKAGRTTRERLYPDLSAVVRTTKEEGIIGLSPGF